MAEVQDPQLKAANDQAKKLVNDFTSQVAKWTDEAAADAVDSTTADVTGVTSGKVIKLNALVMQIHLCTARVICDVLPSYWRAILASIVQKVALTAGKWLVEIGANRWIDVTGLSDLVADATQVFLATKVQRELEQKIRKVFVKARDELVKSTLKQTSELKKGVVYSRHPIGWRANRRPKGL